MPGRTWWVTAVAVVALALAGCSSEEDEPDDRQSGPSCSSLWAERNRAVEAGDIERAFVAENDFFDAGCTMADAN